MHIPDGALSLTTHGGTLAISGPGIAVLSAGAAVAAAGTIIGLRRMDYERVPQVALLSAAFFVVSLVRIPLGPTSVHLVLNGLMGLILGWAAFPAILIALTLQAVLLGYGGLTTLGVNTVTMALPALLCYGLFHRAAHSKREWTVLWGASAAGVVAYVLSALLFGLALLAVGSEFKAPAQTLVLLHLPVALVEGLVSASAVAFLRKVRPELLEAPLLAPGPLGVPEVRGQA